MEKTKSKRRFPLWLKTLIVLLFSVSVVSTVAVVYSAVTLRQTTRNHYVDHSIELADTLGIYLKRSDIEDIKNQVSTIYASIPEEERVNNSHWDEDEWYTYLSHYDSVVESQAYKDLMAQIVLFHSKNDAKYTYLAYADFNDKRLVYLVDDADEDERCLPGSFDEFTEQDMTIFDHFDTGFEPEITNMDEYGYLVSVGRPIYTDENGVPQAFALVDLSMDEIIAQENRETALLIVVLILLSIGAVMTGFLLVSFMIIRPVRKLTKVANEYTDDSNGDLNKFNEIEIKTSDEIEDLANSMKKMEKDINKYIDDLLGAEKKADELRILADKDALTSVGNKRAYFEAEERLNDLIKKGKARFALSMIDLNDLKITNDTLGHEKGDLLIVALSNMIKDIFTCSSVYRIGGDEFIVISEGSDLDRIDRLHNAFTLRMGDDKTNEDKVSAAIGTAVFDPKLDNNVEDTFKRADAEMYEQKKKMKEKRD